MVCYIFAMNMRKLKGLYVALWGLLMVCLLSGFPRQGMARDNAPALPKKPVVADSIMEHMFHSASIYSHEVKGYKGDLYLKGHLKVHKQNRIIKYVPSMFRLEKGINDYFMSLSVNCNIRLLPFMTERSGQYLRLSPALEGRYSTLWTT